MLAFVENDQKIAICACFSGIIVPGGFGVKGFEAKIAAIEWARKNKKPFLGNLIYL